MSLVLYLILEITALAAVWCLGDWLGEIWERRLIRRFDQKLSRARADAAWEEAWRSPRR